MTTEKILLVDDDRNILQAYQRQFRKKFEIEVAEGGAEGLKKIASDGPFAVIVSDMRMPGMDGTQFLIKVKKITPNSVRLMLTGNSDQNTAIQAVNEGNIFRFLSKPCSPEIFSGALNAALEQYRLITAEKELLEKTLKGSVKILTEILSMIDPQSFGRAIKVREYVRTICPVLDVENIWEVELAAMLSQIGLVTIPDEVREKYGTGKNMTTKEKELVFKIPEFGQRIISNIPRLENIAKIVLYQNKSFNGSGPPATNVSGESIPLGSRILKVLFDLDQLEPACMSTFAGEVTGHSNAKLMALGVMKKRIGKYDTKVLDAALKIFSEDVNGNQQTAIPVEVSLSDLHIGDKLMASVTTSDNRVLIAQGHRISHAFLERLRNYDKVVGVREPILVERTVSNTPIFNKAVS